MPEFARRCQARRIMRTMGTVALRLLKLGRSIPLVCVYMSTSLVSRVVANLSGIEGIIKKIRNRVGTENPVYLSIDIDTLDPACKYTPSPTTAIVTQTDATSRPRHRDPGNRRLDHSRTAHDCSRVGWIESHRGGYRRGISCV